MTKASEHRLLQRIAPRRLYHRLETASKYKPISLSVLEKKYEVSELKGDELLDAAKRLHAEIYLHRGFVGQDDIENEIIHRKKDPYQDYAVYFGVTDKATGEVVAIARQIHQIQNPMPLPIFEHLELANDYEHVDMAQLVEISAFVKKRGVDRRVILLLFRKMLQYSQQNHHSYWLFACDEYVYVRLKAMFGPVIKQIGPKKFYMGSKVVPAEINLNKAPLALRTSYQFSLPPLRRLRRFLYDSYIQDKDLKHLTEDVSEEVKHETVETQVITRNDEELWYAYGEMLARIDTEREGEKFDEDDVRSTHIIVTKDNDVIGSIRLINRRDDNPLPIEKHFGVELEGSQLEMSRVVIDPKKAGKLNKIAFLGLLRSVVGEANRRDITYIHAIVQERFLQYLKDIGMTYESIAEPKVVYDHTTVNIPVRINASTAIADIARADRGRKNYLAPFFRLHPANNGLGSAALVDLRFNQAQFVRNLPLSRKEWSVLQESLVAIAGVGGDGGELAIALARKGVRHFRLADPEDFGVENLNRQAGSSFHTIGKNKAEVIADEIFKINPWAVIDVYADGINSENVKEFVDGTDLVLDETEYTQAELGVMLARTCREASVPVLMALNIGYGSRVIAFDPDGKTFESWLGVSESASLDDIAASTDISLAKWIGRVPKYADMNLFGKVQRGEITAPSVVEGVLLAAANAAAQAQNILLSRVSPKYAKDVPYAPKMIVHDVKEQMYKVINSDSRFGFYISAFRAVIRTRLGLNSPDDH